KTRGRGRPRSFLERALLSVFLAVQAVCALPAFADASHNGFRKPPPEARPWVYWFWLNSKSAVGPSRSEAGEAEQPLRRVPLKLRRGFLPGTHLAHVNRLEAAFESGRARFPSEIILLRRDK